MTETIFVRAKKTDNRVALYEVHPHHPQGEVYIAGRWRHQLDADGRAVLDEQGQPVREENIVEVALTPGVQAALNSGRLVEVEAPRRPKRGNKTPKSTTAAAEGPAADDPAADKGQKK